MKSHKELLKQLPKLLVTGIAIAFLIFHIRCPIRWIFSIPCPTCGISRSFSALIAGDFSRSLYYHPLTVPAIALFAFALTKDFFKPSKKTENIVLISGAVIIFAVYLIRLIFFYIP